MFFVPKKDRLALEYASAGILLATVPFLNVPVGTIAFIALLSQRYDLDVALAAVVLFSATYVTPAMILAPYALPLLIACLATDALESMLSQSRGLSLAN